MNFNISSTDQIISDIVVVKLNIWAQNIKDEISWNLKQYRVKL